MARPGEGCERLRDRVDKQIEPSTQGERSTPRHPMTQTVTTGPVERIQHGGASDRSHHQFGCPPTDFLPFTPRSVHVGGMQANPSQSSQWHQADRHRAGQEVQRDRSRLQIGFEGKSKRDSDVAAMGQDFG